MRRSPRPSTGARRRVRRALCGALLATGALASPAAEAPAGADGASFVFEGGGFGHGVGMSQYGARAQGQAGRSYGQILSSYYPGTSLVTGSPPGPVVLLANSSCSATAAATSTTLLPAGGSIAIYINGPSYGQNVPIAGIGSGQAGTVAITGNPGAYFQVTGPDSGGAFGTPSDFLLVVLNGVPTQLGMTGQRYARGNLVLAANAGLLNGYAQDMTMDQYLYGLGEVPSSWPAETLRAQAVAGRTYAERVAAVRRSNGSRFHIYGDVRDQCYQGYEKEAGSFGASWVAAVNATTGQMLTYQGALAQTFYSSSDGGFTESSGYVFTTALPYLPAQADPYDGATGNGNSLYRWSRTFDGDQLGSRIGNGVGRVTSIAVESGSAGASGRVDRVNYRITGVSGSTVISGRTMQSRLGLPSTLIFRIGGAVNTLPAGNFESATVSGLQAVVAGWAADPDSSASVEIDVWVNGSFAGYGYADQPRPDVGQAYPAYGNNRGFSFAVPIPGGTSTVCAYAIDANDSSKNRGLGCRSVTRPTGPPFGNFESITRAPGGAVVQGWALDPDVAYPIEVDAWSSGRLVGWAYADGARPDVASAYPGYGPYHGFAFGVGLDAGTRTVCTYAINTPPGTNPALGCRTIEISPVPLGNLDALSRSGDTVSLYGWALDPDVAGPIEVHVLVDGAFATWTYAAGSRPDVGAAFGPYGPNHGFTSSFGVAPGPHNVCVYGINAGPGTINRFLGCRQV